MATIAWIEQSWLAIWVRESVWGFPVALILHSIGMGFTAGFHFAMNARLLGFAKHIAPAVFVKFLPILWLNLALIVVSGVMLLAAYPAKILTNLVFYLKMLLLGSAVYFTHVLSKRCIATAGKSNSHFATKTKTLAMLSMMCWIAIIVTGRLLAYTHNTLMVGNL